MKNTSLAARLSLLLLRGGPSQGFTMLEVLVALMISFAFLMGTMNAMVIAAVMQVKAERQAQALYWIQQDVESVRAAAASQPEDDNKCTQTFSTSYSGDLRTILDGTSYTSSTPSPLTQTLQLFVKTSTITLNPTFVFDTQNPDPDQYTLVTNDIGQRKVQVVKDSPKKLVGKDYRLVRIVDVYNSTPATFIVNTTTLSNPGKSQIVALSYKSGIPSSSNSDSDLIQDDSNGNTSIVATLYTEILPNAASSC